MEVINGTIRDGKFGGQPVYAPYFWKQAKDGLADARHGNSYIFDITSKDIKEYPELNYFDIVKISCDREGYITCEACYE